MAFSEILLETEYGMDLLHYSLKTL